MKNRQSKTKA